MADAPMNVSGDAAREREVEKQAPVVRRDGGGQGEAQAEAARDDLPPPGATDGGDEQDGRCAQDSTDVERPDAVEKRPGAETPDHHGKRGHCKRWTSPPEKGPHETPGSARPAARNAVPKNISVQETSANSSCIAARTTSQGRRATHSSTEPKRRASTIPSCASLCGALSGALRSSTTQPPPGRRTAAPWAMTVAQSGTCDRA